MGSIPLIYTRYLGYALVEYISQRLEGVAYQSPAHLNLRVVPAAWQSRIPAGDESLLPYL